MASNKRKQERQAQRALTSIYNFKKNQTRLGKIRLQWVTLNFLISNSHSLPFMAGILWKV